MFQEGACQCIVEAAADIECPQCLQGAIVTRFANSLPQDRDHGWIATLGEQAPGGSRVPDVGMIQQCNQVLARLSRKVETLGSGQVAVGNAIDTAIASIPVGVGIGMSRAG